MIKKQGGEYALKSKTTGKTLYKSKDKEAVVKRERQIQYFKNNEQYKKDHNGRSIPIKKKGK
jgi:hypothetical protein